MGVAPTTSCASGRPLALDLISLSDLLGLGAHCVAGSSFCSDPQPAACSTPGRRRAAWAQQIGTPTPGQRTVLHLPAQPD
jgi:hypothetical protein